MTREEAIRRLTDIRESLRAQAANNAGRKVGTVHGERSYAYAQHTTEPERDAQALTLLLKEIAP